MRRILWLFGLIAIVGCSKDKDPVSTGPNYANQDAAFVLQASMVNYTTIQLGHIAGTISTDSAILAFSDLMITEHTLYRQMLIDLSDSLNMQVADSLNPDHLTLRNYLLTLSGRTFDSVYIHSQVQDLTSVIGLHQTEITSGINASVKQFATNHLLEIQEQKIWADSIAANY